MGGLLASEAANHASNNYGAKPSRIVGVIAFDTPFLGMHPHVVITGFASLFRDNDERKKEKTDLNNNSKINIVDQNVTDGWEAFKNSLSLIQVSSRPASISSASNSRSPSPHLSSPFSFVNETMSSFLSSHSEDPFFRWARKHADEPFSNSKRWIVEHFQFGSSMFNPSGLQERYSRLVEWQGFWVNYWTQTASSLLPRTDLTIEQEVAAKTDDTIQRVTIENSLSSSLSITPSDDLPFPSPLAVSSLNAVPCPTSQVALKIANSKCKGNPGQHFVVLPNGLGEALGGWENWEKVVIGGVENEVAAHCGLFIRGQNLNYDGLVERVGRKVSGWCGTI
ncbi:hypothetical protein C0995_003417 [Termitomyces sp. Mi166|nr:hypothetical protein C0995_003417 [Termitomyces sp. Mi166\